MKGESVNKKADYRTAQSEIAGRKIYNPETNRAV